MDLATFAAEHEITEATAAVILNFLEPPLAAEYVVRCRNTPRCQWRNVLDEIAAKQGGLFK